MSLMLPYAKLPTRSGEEPLFQQLHGTLALLAVSLQLVGNVTLLLDGRDFQGFVLSLEPSQFVRMVASR